MVYRQKATQLSLESFGSALGTPLSPDNEWVQYAELIPWAKLEEAYQLHFPSRTSSYDHHLIYLVNLHSSHPTRAKPTPHHRSSIKIQLTSCVIYHGIIK